jgi:hypothetical protein
MPLRYMGRGHKYKKKGASYNIKPQRELGGVSVTEVAVYNSLLWWNFIFK